VTVALPPREVQHTIGSILGAIDDLIENNRRRVEVLEEMARAIYREWFVHFRYPGHENAASSGSLAVPPGWDTVTLGNAARWLSGGTPRTTTAEYWGGGLPWITSGTLTSMLLDRSDRTLTAAGASNGTRVVERDTLLFVVRGMSLIREFRVGIADTRLAFGQDLKALVAVDGIDPIYLAFSVITRADEIQRMVELAGHGTGKLSADRLRAIEIPRPPTAVQARFADVIRPLRQLMTTTRLATDQLRQMRGALLPTLVGGQIDVSSLDLGALIEDSVA
jgi:type I restriction enzyme S subunit